MPSRTAQSSNQAVKLTLLLDLDDTLLDSNMGTFIPAYFQLLSDALREVVSPEQMLPALMGGTRRMMSNQDPLLTLREVFDAYFFPKLDTSRDVLQPAIERFYADVFPALRNLTKPRPEAVQLVDWAFQSGWRVAIATNPLFPLQAVHHRMRWAGLPPEKYHFALVSSYENFHFTKANPAYYAELLGALGCPEGPVIMVGDDLEMDIRSAQTAGLPVYWQHTGDQVVETPLCPTGSLRDFLAWIKDADWRSFKLDFSTAKAIMAILCATPAVLSSLTRNLSEEKWDCKKQPDEWCLTEVMCHLRDVELEVTIPRIRKVLGEDNPIIAGEVTDNWVEQRNYAGQDGRAALGQFCEARRQSIELLSDLTKEWLRSARHTIFGPTSLQEMVGFVAGHDRLHIAQCFDIIL